MNPDSGSGNFNRKLNVALGDVEASDDIYIVELPSYNKKSILRDKHRFATLPAHEEFAKHVEDRRWGAELIEYRGRACRAYIEHPIVRKAEAEGSELPLPISIYLDGVPYSHVDSVIGFWLIFMLTGARVCIGVLRKKLMCKCGCRGWCTLYPIFRWLAWSLKSIALGLFPELDDLAQKFTEESSRWVMRGRKMARRGACLYIKGDWSEYANTLGFPAWNDIFRSCFECQACLDLYIAWGNTAEKLRWTENEDGDYFTACASCEIVIELTARAMKLIIKAGLHYDKKKGRGRCLRSSIGELRLLEGDRLEPSISMPDVGDFEETALGSTVIFWRASRDTLTRHRNPLFDPDIGMTPKRTLTVDTLHALNLGVYKCWGKIAIWYIILADVYGRITSIDADLDNAIRVMRAALTKFESQNKLLTKIHDINRKSIGSKTKPALKTKGAETWTLMLFLLDQFKKHEGRLGREGKDIFDAGDQLRKMNEIFHASGPVVSKDDQRSVFEFYSRHMALMKAYEVFTPKHHLIWHMLKKIDYQGNPNIYATWLDESLNKTLKKACKDTSQITFETSMLMRMRRIMRDFVGNEKRKWEAI